MELKVWHTIVSACAEVRQMLDGKKPSVSPEAQASDATIIVSHSVGVKGSLRNEILAKLDELRGELSKVLSEREVFFVLLPLTIHYDELVLRRLPPNEQTAWPLLQRERFDINDGGDKFYSFAEERLANPDTPPLVFEVLYFCLSDGFMGRYAKDSARITGYKSTLAARIPMPKTPAQQQKRSPPSGSGRRAAQDGKLAGKLPGPGPGPAQAQAQGRAADVRTRPDGSGLSRRSSGEKPAARGSSLFIGLFYVAAAAAVVLLPLVLVWLSNL
jgi:hypothetical protein